MDSTSSIRDDDLVNDSSTIFSTNSIVESTTITLIEDLSSMDDTTTTTITTTTTELTTLLPEANGNDTVTKVQGLEEEKMHNVTVRNKNTSATSGDLEQDFEHANSTVSVQTNCSRITNKSRILKRIRARFSWLNRLENVVLVDNLCFIVGR